LIELLVIYQQISSYILYGFRDKLKGKKFNWIFLFSSNFDAVFLFCKMIVLMINDNSILKNHKKIVIFKKWCKRGPNSEALLFKIVRARQMSKIQRIQHITVSNTLLVQQSTVSSKILCPHLLLIYTNVQLYIVNIFFVHAAVVSCFALHSP
jgi:hypothetical protein